MLHLVGVNHSVQVASSSEEMNDHTTQFFKFLNYVAKDVKVSLIAEELSAEAIEKIGGNPTAFSIAKKVATEMGVEHILCDPNSDERAQLGIPTNDDLMKEAHSMWFSADKSVDKPVQAYMEILQRQYFHVREKIWLERLTLYSPKTKDILLICGADHIDSFSALLAKKDTPFTVIERHWMPR